METFTAEDKTKIKRFTKSKLRTWINNALDKFLGQDKPIITYADNGVRTNAVLSEHWHFDIFSEEEITINPNEEITLNINIPIHALQVGLFTSHLESMKIYGRSYKEDVFMKIVLLNESENNAITILQGRAIATFTCLKTG